MAHTSLSAGTERASAPVHPIKPMFAEAAASCAPTPAATSVRAGGGFPERNQVSTYLKIKTEIGLFDRPSPEKRQNILHWLCSLRTFLGE